MATPPLELTFAFPQIAPCEHIAGSEKFARKAFGIQGKHLSPVGRSLVDVTLDLEDGAPVGKEEELRETFVALIHSSENVFRQVGVRVHPPQSDELARDLEVLLAKCGNEISYITIPKVRSIREVLWIDGTAQHILRGHGITRRIPLHLLIETPEALGCLPALAALPCVEALDFGIMDLISHLGGAIPAECMQSPGQFDHRLLSTVKSQVSLAALSAGKIPTHNVTVNVRDPEAAFSDAYRARHEFGFLRMWSIHPEQVDSIVRAMTPSAEEIAEARSIIAAARAANWGPLQISGRLHDRASFRYYWGVLTRAGETVP